MRGDLLLCVNGWRFNEAAIFLVSSTQNTHEAKATRNARSESEAASV